MSDRTAEQVVQDALRFEMLEMDWETMRQSHETFISKAARIVSALRSAGYITEPPYIVRCGDTAGEYRVSHNDKLGGWVARFCGDNAKSRAEAECARLNER